jgi:hypothetical protein
MTCEKKTCVCHGIASTIESSMWEDDRRLPIHYSPAAMREIEALRAERAKRHPVGRCGDRQCACQFSDSLAK